jgi:opacity protein-like surface antigen
MIRRRFQEISALALLAAMTAGSAMAQEALPDIEVGKPKPVRSSSKPKSKPAAARVAEPRPSPPVVAAAPKSEVERAEEKFDATEKASSEKFTTGKEIMAVPFTRPGEALETALPGLMVTQHSGEGKANQYQLRGFQLDHGTDLAITLDGMPLNMPTHGHGQGYADTNFLIPELFSYVIGKKGPYFADEGDFATAGAVHIQYKEELPGGLFSATAGSFDYGRLLGVNSDKVAGGALLSAVELGILNGPWTVPDAMHKINGVLRWSQGTDENGFSVTAMAYANHWHASNQIPERAVTEGVISLWGNIDPTDRGDTTRFSLSTRWSEADANSHSRIEAYAIHTTLDLFNNFDYYLTQPIIGDQFRQFDRRTILGLKAEHGWNYEFAGFPMETRIGLQSRYDDIRVGLQDTYQTMAYNALTNDQVAEGNVGVWTDTTVHWNPWLRTTTGIRGDFFAATIGDYQNALAAPTNMPFGTLGALPIWTRPWNSGHKAAAMDSPKLAIVLGPWEKTEFFIDAGEGFHSTDARGTVTTLNPPDGSPAATIPLLVKARGAEVGARTKYIEGLDSTISLWWLNIDSESQFDGDTGTTLFGRPSRRYGVEFTNHYSFNDWLHFDGDLALSHARSRGWDAPQSVAWAQLVTPQTIGYFTYLGNAPGNYIPEAPPIVASVAVELGKNTGWFGGLKYRFKGAYPLTEDGYFRAPATGTLNMRVGYKWENGLKFQLDGFNILNSRSDQITYAYGSLLPTDALFAPCQNGIAPAAVCAIGQMDRHFKPIEPGAIRATLSGPLSPHVFDPIFAPQPNAASPLKDFLALAADLSDDAAYPRDKAANPPNKKGPLGAPPPRPVWTGPYVGLNAGVAFGGDNKVYYSTRPVAAGFDLGATGLGAGVFGNSNAGFIGGGQLGYNYQLTNRALVGLEADIQGVAGGSGVSTAVNAAPSVNFPGNNLLGALTSSQKLDYIGTARGRIGYLFTPTTLFYATGGLAYGQSELNATSQLLNVTPVGVVAGLGFGAASYSNMRVGYAVGGGLEWMFMPNWSAKAEYLYYDLGGINISTPQMSINPATGSVSSTVATYFHSHADGQIVRAGLNYHFNWGAPAPVIAKY